MTIDKSKGAEVHGIFEKVAGYYDRMNFLMTLGSHGRWCREVAARAAPPAGGQLLDIATGTGVIALEAARRYPSVTVTGVDFSEEMLTRARTKPGAQSVRWQHADAARLPFDDESFDGITQGYLLRTSKTCRAYSANNTGFSSPAAGSSSSKRVLRAGR
nr:class I SAM-dependent methyltransferase [Nocardia lijiangensis]